MQEEAELKRREEEEEVDFADIKKSYTVEDITQGLNK